MKAIILAAGKGSRLYPLTKDTSKTLVKVSGKPILHYVLESLPEEIDEIILVVKHFEEKIREYISKEYSNKNISIITQGEQAGTWGALMSTKNLIGDGEYFMVLSGDDISKTEDLKKFTKEEILYGVNRRNMPMAYHDTLVDKDGFLEGFQKRESSDGEILASTGVYTLNKGVLVLDPVSVGGDEYGIPQTLLKHKGFCPVKIVKMSSWTPINTKEDLEAAEK
jgi:NDP-sugar pyrophosphorylase family protein